MCVDDFNKNDWRSFYAYCGFEQADSCYGWSVILSSPPIPFIGSVVNAFRLLGDNMLSKMMLSRDLTIPLGVYSLRGC